MASIGLGALGSAFFGPLGGFIGSTIGSMIDSAVFTPKVNQEGPRLDSLKVQDAAYGGPIPLCYGTVKIAGNIIAAADLIEIKERKKVAKKTRVTTYTYFADFAVGLAAGPITKVKRIWGDTKLIYDDGEILNADNVRIYNGTETQTVDPLLLSMDPLATPHRGTAYIVFERLALANFGNRIPQIHVEFEAIGGAAPRLDHVVQDILRRTLSLQRDEVDVSDLQYAYVYGFIIDRDMSARAALQALQEYEPFDLIESGGVLKAVRRRSHVDFIVDESDLGAVEDNTEAQTLLTRTRGYPFELPRECVIRYIDRDRGYDPNAARASKFSGGSTSSLSFDLPIVMRAGPAKARALDRLFTAWNERETVSFSLPMRYLEIDPGDVLRIGERAIRVTSTETNSGVINMSGVIVNPNQKSARYLMPPADTNPAPTPVLKVPGLTTLKVLDIPPLVPEDNDSGVYVVSFVSSPVWNGASLYRSRDGVAFERLGAMPDRATYGTVAAPFGEGEQTIRVVLEHGELESVPVLSFNDGQNLAMIGDELMHFSTATLVAEKTYDISGLQRARYGTGWAVGSHAGNERFILIESGAISRFPINLSDIGTTFTFRSASTGTMIDDAADYTHTYQANSLRPLPPAELAGTRDTDGNLSLTWVRRSRLYPHWEGTPPLDESAERYDVDILNDAGDVVRTFSSVATPWLTYTAEQQIADFPPPAPTDGTEPPPPTPPPSVRVCVYQLSFQVGRGQKSEATV